MPIMNYVEYARTNYFQVKDEAAFLAWAAQHHLEVTNGAHGFALFPDPRGETGFDLRRVSDEDEDEVVDVDFHAELARHLQPHTPAIIITIGYEGRRYHVGTAVAVNHLGECISVSLGEIYDKVANQWGIQPNPAEY